MDVGTGKRSTVKPRYSAFQGTRKIIPYITVFFTANQWTTMKTLLGSKIGMLYWRYFLISLCAIARFHCTLPVQMAQGSRSGLSHLDVLFLWLLEFFFPPSFCTANLLVRQWNNGIEWLDSDDRVTFMVMVSPLMAMVSPFPENLVAFIVRWKQCPKWRREYP